MLRSDVPKFKKFIQKLENVFYLKRVSFKLEQIYFFVINHFIFDSESKLNSNCIFSYFKCLQKVENITNRNVHLFATFLYGKRVDLTDFVWLFCYPILKNVIFLLEIFQSCVNSHCGKLVIKSFDPLCLNLWFFKTTEVTFKNFNLTNFTLLYLSHRP